MDRSKKIAAYKNYWFTSHYYLEEYPFENENQWKEYLDDIYLNKVNKGRAAAVLIMRMEGHTLQEIADCFGTSRERIRQIEFKAWRRIRELHYKSREQLHATAHI